MWNTYFDFPPHSSMARVAAFSPTGETFIVGYSDGSLVVRPTVNVLPALTITSASGGVRDMLVDETSGNLYVATRNGILLVLPLCDSCVTNRPLPWWRKSDSTELPTSD